jgi:hypothetical protein
MKTNLAGIIYAHCKYIKQKLINTKRYRLTKAAIEYLETDDCVLSPEEKVPINTFLSENFLIVPFCYPFVKDYLYRKIPVFFDGNRALYYLYHKNHKLYFRKGLKKNEVIEQYNSLCIEQHEKSPHSYDSFNIDYQPDDIAVDAGAAEGIWGLNIIDRVKKLYLFECEDEWIEALNATFAPWKEKVHIIKKIVSNETDNDNITLDDFFKEEAVVPTVLKADVEGYEKALTEGATDLLSNSFRHVILCTYHKKNDHQDLSSVLTQYKFNVKTSQGYLIFIWDGNDYYSGDIGRIFRKALIYGHK